MTIYRYVILKTSDVDLIDFSKVVEEGADDLVYSLDGLNTYVRFIGEPPSFLEDKLANGDIWILTASQARGILENVHWDEYSVVEPLLGKDDI